jgi:hypothetical protein
VLKQPDLPSLATGLLPSAVNSKAKQWLLLFWSAVVWKLKPAMAIYHGDLTPAPNQ